MIFSLCILFILFIGALCFMAYRKGVFIWLPVFVQSFFRKKEKPHSSSPVHIMFCFVDHYEPGNGKADNSLAKERVSLWIKDYPILASKHKDADGIVPQHTWFYPPHNNQSDHLARIVSLCQDNFGEIEMQLCHNHFFPSTEKNGNLAQKIKSCVKSYAKLGIWGEIDGKKSYGFIHGNGSFVPNTGEAICGVANELSILKSTGCYANFTFPAHGRYQPRMVNSIYYAQGHSSGPKYYDKGIPVKCGGRENGDLMIIQGPKGIRWRGKPFLSQLCIENSEIDFTNVPTKKRIDYWIKNGICIAGQPNWIFIKVFCYGALEQSYKSILGKYADKMYSYLENKYNDGKLYQLHYVTAREMYNIIKAAERGKVGNPNNYRDFAVSRPDYSHNGK